MNRVVLITAFLSIVQFVYCQQNEVDAVIADTVISAIPEQKVPESPKIRKDTRPIKDRISLGFGSSFWINPNQTYIELAPVVAYRFPKRLITGMGYRYIYRHQRVGGEDLEAYGPNAFARLNLLKRIYFWTEYEILNTEYLVEIAGQPTSKNTTTTNSWFVGLGYIKRVGKKGRGGISVQLLYNILYNREDNSPYYSPITYRVGYYF